MSKKLTVAALLGLSSCFAYAQTAPNLDASGSFDGVVKVLASVPQMCEIESNLLAEVDFGEYIGQAVTIPVNIPLKCKSNTSLTFSVDNGSNPNSTVTERRLPISGKTGDVPNYLLYKLTSDSVGANLIGTNTDSYVVNTGTVGSNYMLKFYGHLSATQPGAIVGKYSEELNATIDYN